MSEWQRLVLYALTDALAHNHLLVGTLAAYLQRQDLDADLLRRYLQSPDPDRYRIQWKVDGTVVHERVGWDPTPVPDQPLEFNVNLWSSESAEFAGPLDRRALPAALEITSLAAQI